MHHFDVSDQNHELTMVNLLHFRIVIAYPMAERLDSDTRNIVTLAVDTCCPVGHTSIKADII